MGTGLSNFKASCWSQLNAAICPAPKIKIRPQLRKDVNLWEFIFMDARPLMIVEKKAALIRRYDVTITDSIVFRNEAFVRVAAALDLENLLGKLLDAKPGSPLYITGRLWGNYLIHDGKYIVITGDSTQYNEALAWTPAEGWRPPEAPSSNYPYQYIQTETSRYKLITRDATPPSHPTLDWTRKSRSRWVPGHYREFIAVRWKDTLLGDVTGWPGSLRTIVNTIMVHPYQMVLYWAKEYVMIYNSSFAASVINRHPALLGQELAKAWPPAYEKIREHLENCRRGMSVIRTADSVPVDRGNSDEECYFDWTLTPVLEKAGTVGGVLWTQYEGTARILQNRRREMLKNLRMATANARNTEDFWKSVLEAFDSNTLDSPFVALYEVQRNNENEGILLGTRGIPQGHALAPRVIVLADAEGYFSHEIIEARLKGSKVKKGNLQNSNLMRGIDRRGFGAPCTTAVIIPIEASGDEKRMEAFLILGINPRRRLDDDYEIWLDQIQENITVYLGEVRSNDQIVKEAMREQLADAERRRASELSQRLAELTAELRKKEMRFTNMASAIPTGLIEMDPFGAAIFTNDAWHEIMMIARDRDEKTWGEAIHKDDREWWSKRLEDAFNAKVHLPIEYRVVDTSEGFYNDKKVKWVVSEVLPVFDEDTGKLHGFYSTVADITPLKLAEVTQKERADEALERTRQQERFIDMTCHELRNPLSAILQYSELILDLLDDHEKNEAKPINVDTITEACNTIILCTTHQRRIIDDILVTSKLDSGLMNVELVDFQPAKYLEKSLKMYDAESRSKGIDLSIVIEKSYKGLEVNWVKGDPARIMQILSNLMTNSIKFTTGQTKKTITVYIAASEEEPTSYGDVEFFKDENSEDVPNNGPSWGSGDTVYLIVTVRDSGIGIPQDVQQTLFARFQQAPKTETKYGGSGLGLYICKNLTRLLGGSIGVASEPDEGSQFSFYVRTQRGTKPDKEAELPGWLAQATKRVASTPTRTEVSTTAPPEAAAGRLQSAVSGFKILVVEDNLINQKVMKRQLEARQCTVFTANNGKEAVEFVKSSSLNPSIGHEGPDIEICFMDCEMPVMNGIVASQKIRELEAAGSLSRHLPILGVSANVRGPKVQEMKDAGMDDVISKPFSIEELIRAAASLVNTQAVQNWNNQIEHDRRSRKSPVPSVGVVIGEGSRKGSIVEYTERSRRVSEPEVDLTGRVGRR